MDIEPSLTQALADEPAIACAWLFGSRARGTARDNSDIDVAIVADPPAGSDPVEWRWELEARLSARLHRSVQVVAFERAPADLAKRIVRDGHLLVDRDRSRRIALEVRKRAEYFDMTPVWRRIRRLPPGVAP